MTYPLTKTCDYCHQETRYVPIRTNPTPSGRIRFIPVFWCSDCSAEYVFIGDNPNINLYTIINGETYRWSPLLGYEGRLWHVGKPGIPGGPPNKDLKMLKRFEGENCPDITPQNIHDKIRTILLFM